MNLPEEFITTMKIILDSDFDKYIECLDEKPHNGIRINTSKISEEAFRQLSDSFEDLKKVPWCDCGMYYDNEIKLSKNPFYFAGLYYIQEPSAMLPGAVLPIKDGDRVLDLCAAPGGKSTQLASKLNGTGAILANDISNTRAKALLKNLELFGFKNIAVSSENHEKLNSCFNEYFDKILVDAPCSGEGMFRREPSMVNSWLAKGPDYYAEIQAGILEHAYSMLKPGGMMLFSTCTFSPLENEANVYRILKNHDDAKLIPINISKGMRSGLTDEILLKLDIIKAEDCGSDIFTRCARIFPNDGYGEGHFAALIQKSSYGKTAVSDSEIKDNHKYVALNKETLKLYPKAAEFFSNIPDDFMSGGIIKEINEKLYLLPIELETDNRIRYLRTGLFLGELSKNKKNIKNKNTDSAKKQKNPDTNLKFEPSQALAMALSKSDFSNVLDLSQTDVRTVKYLKGETIECSEDCNLSDGWCLVCVNGYPLGFAVNNSGSLKNKYYAGWRLQ